MNTQETAKVIAYYLMHNDSDSDQPDCKIDYELAIGLIFDLGCWPFIIRKVSKYHPRTLNMLESFPIFHGLWRDIEEQLKSLEICGEKFN